VLDGEHGPIIKLDAVPPLTLQPLSHCSLFAVVLGGCLEPYHLDPATGPEEAL